MTWRPDPWPRRNADAEMVAVRDGSKSSGTNTAGRSTLQQAASSSAAAPKQCHTKKRAQKRKCCDVAEEPAEALGKTEPQSRMGHALTKAPQYLYTVGGEALSGARSSIQASGALWSTDAWLEQPSSWQEHRVSVVDPASVNTGITRTKYDKAFCAEWITNSQLAVSTKCGHVLRVDRDKKTYKEINLAGSRWVEPPINTEEDLHRYRVDRGGIHSLHANRAKHLLACSGCYDDDNNVYVLDLLSDKWATVKQGKGHKNWVFTLSWISDHAFVTGGRDKSVLLWSPLATDRYVMDPVARYDVHHAKVRCSSYDRDTERLVTMDVSGLVYLWDGVGTGDMRVLRKFQIPHMYKEECTCMMLSDNMLMAGARDMVTIYDPRRPVAALSIPLARMNYWQAFPQVYPPSVAARSLAVHGCMISIGLSTGGTIICLDKRMLSGGAFETKVATHNTTKWFQSDGRLKDAARALTACVQPHPELPSWVQSKCASEVIFAGKPAPRQPDLSHASLLAPPVKAGRYNLRQRSKIKIPPRFATAVSRKPVKAVEKPATKPEDDKPPPPPPQSDAAPVNIGPELPISSHTLRLDDYISPKAILKQPHGEVHNDDIVNSGFQVENAIFSHAWSPDGCALFSCGGPLAMGVRGCYMALWC